MYVSVHEDLRKILADLFAFWAGGRDLTLSRLWIFYYYSGLGILVIQT